MKKLTTKMVQERLVTLAGLWIAGDNEAFTQAESQLYRDVLCSIADGNDDAASLANEALRSWGMDIKRWYS